MNEEQNMLYEYKKNDLGPEGERFRDNETLLITIFAGLVSFIFFIKILFSNEPIFHIIVPIFAFLIISKQNSSVLIQLTFYMDKIVVHSTFTKKVIPYKNIKEFEIYLEKVSVPEFL